MTDRELLELAAKAAGKYAPKKDCPKGWEGIRPETFGCFTMGGEGATPDYQWNPLQDDGDCARLESACGVNVKWFFELGGVNAWVEDVNLEPGKASAVEYYSDHGGDKNAARRRAVVEVVASIQCAKVVEGQKGVDDCKLVLMGCAAAIRARSNKEAA